MKSLTCIFLLVCPVCPTHAGEPAHPDLLNHGEWERYNKMGQVTICAGESWRMRVMDDGSVRLSAIFPGDGASLPPGTCDKAAIIRDLPGSPPPGGHLRSSQTLAYLSLQESAQETGRVIYPDDPFAAIRAIRRVIGKVPANQRDALRSALTRLPLVSEGNTSNADSKRLRKFLTPGQEKALGDWLGGAPGILRGVTSLESPELSLLFGDDTFVWLTLDMRAAPKDAAVYRTVLVHEREHGAKALPASETTARFRGLLEEAGHKVRNGEEARLAAGAFAALQRVQTFGPLAVEKNADGFAVKWKLFPPDATGEFVERQARFPESVRFRCDAQGRVLKAEPKLPELRKESGQGAAEKQSP